MDRKKWLMMGAFLLLAAWGNFSGCAISPPTTGILPTPTPVGQGTIVVNDAATGSCPVNLWLDNTGPYLINPGTIKTFSHVAYGTHNLTFTTTTVTSCGSGPVTCHFYGSQTGTSCNFYVSSSYNTQTAAITDNGCNNLSVTCPY